MKFFGRKKPKEPVVVPPPKILILRFSSIGDIVLTTPVIRGLKQQVPQVTIHYLTKKSFLPVLKANPYIDGLLSFEEQIDDIIPWLKKQSYTHIIDLHNNLRSARVKQALRGIPAFTVNKLNIRKWILVNFKWNLMPRESIVNRYMKTVAPLGVRPDGKGLDYFIPEKDRITNEDIPMSHWAGYIGCVIGGTYPTKQLTVEKWKELCANSPYPIMLLGGPDDREAGNEIATIDKIKIYNACGKFNINESADLVDRAKVIVTNDTGLMHIAAAQQKPIVALWGNTVPELGMFPYYGFNHWNDAPANLKNMRVPHLKCQPCSKLGYGSCPRRHFNCMRQQDTIEITAWIKKYWSFPTN